jgi:hypothetical protein
MLSHYQPAERRPRPASNGQTFPQGARAGQRVSILAIGAERPEEFAAALRRARSRDRVIVVNPRRTNAAKSFVQSGGNFIQAPVQNLPDELGPFDLVLENYPFTVGLVEGVCEQEPCPFWRSSRAVRNYAVPRLRQLGPGGRWILWTESPGLARTLRRLIRTNPSLTRNFAVRIDSAARRRAPRSSYPHLQTRFRVTIERLTGADQHRRENSLMTA